ncbi:MAG TPA: DUF2442 domain-containing protein [Thermoanaerobaculia bacterium]|jgi:hypothetical protein|nr:DUF2442 domain-containing protein [Thermoanaerobaculia bacterium]
MSSLAVDVSPLAQDVRLTDDELVVLLIDGRTISVPLAWFPRLLHATAGQRLHLEILGDGEGTRWPEINEDISVAGLLRGIRAPARIDRRA